MTQPYLTIAEIAAFIAAAALVARLAHSLIHRALSRLEIVGPEDRAAVQARAARLIRALTMLAYGVAAIAGVSLALARLGWRTRAGTPAPSAPGSRRTASTCSSSRSARWW